MASRTPSRPPATKPDPRPSLFETTVTPSATPASGFITAHCDGGARGNPGPAGYGAEITDANGIVLAQISEFLGFRTNNFAEYSGLLASLQFALDHGHKRLRVISDSELMVKQIQGRYKVNSPDLKPLWAEARARIARLSSFEMTHALRHKNKAADALANQAMDRGMGRSTPAGAGANQGEGRPIITTPGSPGVTGPPATIARNGVVSLPLRALPSPNNSEAPPAPSTFDPRPQPLSSPPQQAVPLSSPPQRSEAERPPSPTTPTMLRGFTRDGTVHLLGSHTLPDGIFVKIIPE